MLTTLEFAMHRFSSSVPKPRLESRHLYPGHRMASNQVSVNLEPPLSAIVPTGGSCRADGPSCPPVLDPTQTTVAMPALRVARLKNSCTCRWQISNCAENTLTEVAPLFGPTPYLREARAGTEYTVAFNRSTRRGFLKLPGHSSPRYHAAMGV
jgi:hypothetical protein